MYWLASRSLNFDDMQIEADNVERAFGRDWEEPTCNNCLDYIYGGKKHLLVLTCCESIGYEYNLNINNPDLEDGGNTLKALHYDSFHNYPLIVSWIEANDLTPERRECCFMYRFCSETCLRAFLYLIQQKWVNELLTRFYFNHRIYEKMGSVWDYFRRNETREKGLEYFSKKIDETTVKYETISKKIRDLTRTENTLYAFIREQENRAKNGPVLTDLIDIHDIPDIEVPEEYTDKQMFEDITPSMVGDIKKHRFKNGNPVIYVVVEDGVSIYFKTDEWWSLSPFNTLTKMKRGHHVKAADLIRPLYRRKVNM